MRTWFGRIVAACPGLLITAPIAAQATQQVSVDSAGLVGNRHSSSPSISADGRFVAFWSDSFNLVANDTNAVADVFLHDRQLGTTRRMSVASSGAQGDHFSTTPEISADGRFVGFASRAGNLVPGDTNGVEDIFVRDRLDATTELVSVALGGGPGNGSSAGPFLSADGRFVLFQSFANDLVAGDTNGATDVFVRDRQTGTTERVNLATGGGQGGGSNTAASISGDGRYAVFTSSAVNLVPGDLNDRTDVFVRDRLAGTTERVSVDSDELESNENCSFGSITPDGRYVAFTSFADNLVPGDSNLHTDVFLRDRQLGTTELVSLGTAGGQGNFDCGQHAISADGRWVAFQSTARNLIAGDTNLRDDIFLRDRLLGTLERVSVSANSAQADGASLYPALSADGRWIAFQSLATNLVAGDFNVTSDIFVRDRDATGFTSLCDPGVGVVSCPCSNPAAGPTRGCNNSSNTGGAVLAASGVTSLAADSLVFTTNGQRPTALSIVLQGQGFVAGGVEFGQGIRCVGGVLKRLYTRNAVGGSIAAPDLGAGELSVSAQSAAKGDPISPGQPRWYIVYYRDNVVLGGCPATSTFNATQTGQVSWSP